MKIEVISAVGLWNYQEQCPLIQPKVLLRLIGPSMDIADNEKMFASNEAKAQSSSHYHFDNFIADFTVSLPEISFITFTVIDGKAFTEGGEGGGDGGGGSGGGG